MALRINAVLIFKNYETLDDGINLHFTCTDPGPGEASDYYVLITDTDLTTVTTQADLTSLIRTKLQRRYRASGIATKLDPFIGQSLTI